MDSSQHDKKLVGTTTFPVDEAAKFNPAISTTDYGARETIPNEAETVEHHIEESGGGWFAYLKTRNFYIVLAIG